MSAWDLYLAVVESYVTDRRIDPGRKAKLIMKMSVECYKELIQAKKEEVMSVE